MNFNHWERGGEDERRRNQPTGRSDENHVPQKHKKAVASGKCAIHIGKIQENLRFSSKKRANSGTPVFFVSANFKKKRHFGCN